jgi:hypothetical protein
LIHPFLMVRRAAIARVGGYRHVHNSEDSDLFWRLADIGTLHNLERTLGQYRVHTGSISSASILNGRIMAISSQLAAISAMRRKAGRQDLVFAASAKEEYRKQFTMEKMCEVASKKLDTEEAQHLRIASAVKLLELAAYRPYNLEISDCAFIKNSLRFAGPLSVPNKQEIRWHLTTTAARLFRTYKFAEARALAPITAYPVVAARALLLRGNVKNASPD